MEDLLYRLDFTRIATRIHLDPISTKILGCTTSLELKVAKHKWLPNLLQTIF